MERCLKSIKGIIDDIIVVDTGSVDSTKEIAMSFDAKVFDYVWKNDFSDARNFALSKSDSDWNLILDADEYLVKGSRGDISKFMDNMDSLGAIQIKSSYMDNDEISYGIDYITSIIPKGVYYLGKIHEQVNSTLPRIAIPLIFEHDGYLMPNKPERNLPILLDELVHNPNDPYFLYQTASVLVDMNRHIDAVKYFESFYDLVNKNDNYYRKGVIRYIYSLIEIENFEEAMKIIDEVKEDLQKYADFNFICSIFYMKAILFDIVKYQNYLPMIENGYLKCLEIGEVPQHQGVYGCRSFKATYNLGTGYEAAINRLKQI